MKNLKEIENVVDFGEFEPKKKSDNKTRPLKARLAEIHREIIATRANLQKHKDIVERLSSQLDTMVDKYNPEIEMLLREVKANDV